MERAGEKNMIVFLIFAVLGFCIVYACAGFTADEIGYVLGLIVGHPVHIGHFVGFILNVVFNAFIIPLDIIICLLRSVGAI